MVWWDPAAEGEPGTATEGTGLYRFARGGRRYVAGELPGSAEEAGLFDDAAAVDQYSLPPDPNNALDYPPPG